MEQANEGKVSSWISNVQLDYLSRGRRHPNVFRYQFLQLAKVWFEDNCGGKLHKAFGLIVGIPMIPMDAVGWKVSEVQNIVITLDGVWMGFDNV